MANPFFSIIVPVYKVEQYLDQCIKSVLNQSFNEYELILVDDGSPDRCGEMCDSYAADDPRIKVIHKANGGLSSARNAGLDIANGEYVVFLDSDDFWDEDKALKNVFLCLKESDADLLVFNAKRYYGVEKESTQIIDMAVDRKKIVFSPSLQAIAYMIENNIYRAAAWNKAIKKSIIQENCLRFKEGYLSEDMDWCGNLLLCCKKYDYYSSSFYCYRQQRKGSITEGKVEKLVADKLYMCKEGLDQALSLDASMGKIIGSYYAYEYSVAIGVSGGIKNKRILAELKELEPLLKYDICNKVKKVNKLKRALGFYLTRLALCLFVRIK